MDGTEGAQPPSALPQYLTPGLMNKFAYILVAGWAFTAVQVVTAEAQMSLDHPCYCNAPRLRATKILSGILQEAIWMVPAVDNIFSKLKEFYHYQSQYLKR